MTPKYSPFCNGQKKYPQNLHTPKYIWYFNPPPPKKKKKNDPSLRMYENTRDPPPPPPRVVGGVGWSGVGLGRVARTQGGGGYSQFLFTYIRLGPSIYSSPKKNIRNLKHPKKIFEILENPKIYPNSVQRPEEKSLKCIEITPKYSPILWWPPKISTKSIFIPQKIFIFWKPPKILKFIILNQKKWPEPTYVWKYQSTPPPPPPLGARTQVGILVIVVLLHRLLVHIISLFQIGLPRKTPILKNVLFCVVLVPETRDTP